MSSWVNYCRKVSRQNKMQYPSMAKLTGIRISERDARDTYCELAALSRSGCADVPFEQLSALTVHGIEIIWERV